MTWGRSELGREAGLRRLRREPTGPFISGLSCPISSALAISQSLCDGSYCHRMGAGLP